MNIEILTLCDAATVDGGGKINILGSFDRINSSVEPIVQPNCAIAVKIRIRDGEEGVHAMRLSFTTPEGTEVMPDLNFQINVQIPEGELSATFQVILQIQQLTLPNFGEYSIDLWAGNNQLGSMPVFARRIEPPPQSFGPH